MSENCSSKHVFTYLLMNLHLARISLMTTVHRVERERLEKLESCCDLFLSLPSIVDPAV